jgi:hypothetical protein
LDKYNSCSNNPNYKPKQTCLHATAAAATLTTKQKNWIKGNICCNPKVQNTKLGEKKCNSSKPQTTKPEIGKNATAAHTYIHTYIPDAH